MGQYNRKPSQKATFLIINIGIIFFGSNAQCGMTEQDYKAALITAEKKVLRQARAQSDPHAVSTTLVKELFGRFYRVGDSWEVAAWQNVPTTMRMTGEENHLQSKLGNGGIFHYEVVNLKSGAQPQIVLQITQVKKFGMNEVDPKVAQMHLTLSDQYIQSRKSYLMNGSTQEIQVSHEGIHSSISPLELFPLDVPDVFTAEKMTQVTMPVLHPKIQTFLDKVGIKPNFASSKMFEQDDFFGRPIQVLWNQGEPWPAYLKTSGGIAVLINKGNL